MTDVHRDDSYVVDEVDAAEIERLVSFARIGEPDARDGLLRAGIRSGQKAIDVGCGPLGALSLLSELAGPTGKVVGLDMDAASLQTARVILDGQEHRGVELIHGNINDLPNDALCPPGPFDLAFCRLFLMHQSDPVATLRRIGAILQPGGFFVAHEVLFPVQVPPFDPPLPAFQRTWDWFNEAYRQRGVPGLHAARQYRTLCEQSGLTEVSQRGFFSAAPAQAASVIEVQRGNLQMMRSHIVDRGIASDAAVEEALQELEAAETCTFNTFFFVPFVELIAQAA